VPFEGASSLSSRSAVEFAVSINECAKVLFDCRPGHMERHATDLESCSSPSYAAETHNIAAYRFRLLSSVPPDQIGQLPPACLTACYYRERLGASRMTIEASDPKRRNVAGCSPHLGCPRLACGSDVDVVFRPHLEFRVDGQKAGLRSHTTSCIIRSTLINDATPDATVRWPIVPLTVARDSLSWRAGLPKI
jgi:hypothetical protein